MSANFRTLVLSVAVSVAWMLWAAKIPGLRCAGGFDCLGNVFIIIFIYFIGIPLIFGSWQTLSKENRSKKQARYSFGIALLVAVAVFVPFFLKTKAEQKADCLRGQEEARAFREAHPELVKMVYTPPPCE